MKNIKNLRKTINLNFQFKHGMIQKIVTGNPPIKIYVIKIENRITFKIRTWYYSELLTPETMKLVGITNSKTPPVVTGICDLNKSQAQQHPRMGKIFLVYKLLM